MAAWHLSLIERIIGHGDTVPPLLALSPHHGTCRVTKARQSVSSSGGRLYDWHDDVPHPLHHLRLRLSHPPSCFPLHRLRLQRAVGPHRPIVGCAGCPVEPPPSHSSSPPPPPDRASHLPRRPPASVASTRRAPVPAGSCCPAYLHSPFSSLLQHATSLSLPGLPFSDGTRPHPLLSFLSRCQPSFASISFYRAHTDAPYGAALLQPLLGPAGSARHRPAWTQSVTPLAVSLLELWDDWSGWSGLSAMLDPPASFPLLHSLRLQAFLLNSGQLTRLCRSTAFPALQSGRRWLHSGHSGRPLRRSASERQHALSSPHLAVFGQEGLDRRHEAAGGVRLL